MMKPTLLVVDDDPDVRNLLNVGLRDMFDVEEAATAEAALDFVADRRFAAILLDIALPGLDGLTCLELLRLSNPGLPIYAISAHSVEAEALARHASGFFAKPFNLQRIRSVLQPAILERIGKG